MQSQNFRYHIVGIFHQEKTFANFTTYFHCHKVLALVKISPTKYFRYTVNELFIMGPLGVTVLEVKAGVPQRHR